MLTEALNRILSWIERYQPSDETCLEPGLSDAEIEKLVKRLPFQLPSEIYELYRWRNGTIQKDEVIKTAFIFENWTFFTLQEAVKQYYSRRENDAGFNIFTLFYNRDACKTGYVLIDPRVEKSSVIFENCREVDLSFLQIYTSLTTMMLTIAECYETGAYSLNKIPYGGFYIDWTWKKVYPIWRKYNDDAIASVIQILENNSPNYVLLRFFAEILTEFKDPKSMKILIKALQIPLDQKSSFDEDIEVTYINNTQTKIEAAQILGRLGDLIAVPALIDILNSNYSDNYSLDGNYLDNDFFYSDYQTVRFYAAKALGQLKARQAIDSLTKSLNDPHDEIREIAAWALNEIEKFGAI